MKTLPLSCFLFILACAPSQSQELAPNWSNLYDCEGCEAIFEGPAELSWKITIAREAEPGERLIVAGRVLKADGVTPAANVIVYFYHTSAEGIYPTRGDEFGWGRRHGYLRGWLKTNEKGHYEITTLRPGGYPSRRDPAHIHLTVKEPGRKEYWIDDIVFDDDPLVTQSYREQARNRGGSGIIRLEKKGTFWHGTKDIVLAPE